MSANFWSPAAAAAKLRAMVTTNASADSDARLETDTERQHQLAREADLRSANDAERHRRLTLEGLADVDAGRLIDDEAMRAWADSLGTNHELPAPQSR